MIYFSQTVRVWEVSSGVCLSSFNIGQLSPSTVTAVSSDQVIGGLGGSLLPSLIILNTGDSLYSLSSAVGPLLVVLVHI